MDIVQIYPCTKPPPQKKWGMVMFTIFTSIIEIQIMISIEIYAFNKVIYSHYC